MATYRTLANGKTKAQVYLGLPDKQFATKTLPTKYLAERWARQTEAARDRGELDQQPDPTTIGTYYGQIEPGRAAVLASSTRGRNESQWRIHLQPAFAHLKLTDIRRSTVQTWVAKAVEAGVGAPTIEGAVRLLSAIFESAVSDDLVLANPVRGVKIPRHSPRVIRWIGPDEMDAVVTELDEPYRLLVDLAANTGMRWGEVAGLRADAVDTRRGLIEVRTVLERDGWVREYPKTDTSRRVVSIPERLQQRVREAKIAAGSHGLLFTGPHGGTLSDRNVNRRHLTPACRRAGVEPFTFHATRHAYISWMVASGTMELMEIAKLVGHSSTRMIERVYGHLRPGVHDRAARALDRIRAEH